MHKGNSEAADQLGSRNRVRVVVVAVIGQHLNPASASKELLVGEPRQVPSVGCLLYLAADHLLPLKWAPWQLAVPCRRVRVDRSQLRAIVAAATYLGLRDRGHVRLRLIERADPNRPPGRPKMLREMVVNAVASTPPGGLPGDVLKATLGLTHGHLGLGFGRFGAQPGALAETLPGGELLRSVRWELSDLEYAGNCARITALEEACAEAVHWWQELQGSEASLCKGLVEACRVAFRPPRSDGGG